MMKNEEKEQGVFSRTFDLALWEERHFAVTEILYRQNIKRVADFGCAQATFLQRLTRSTKFQLLVGIDLDRTLLLETSIHNLQPEGIQNDLKYSRSEKLRVVLFRGDVTKPHPEIKQFGIEAITLIEVIQHLQPALIPALNQCVFGYYAPQYVVLTTPNYEFNRHFLSPFKFRHWDHKFEWTREEFKQYCDKVAEQFGYTWEGFGVGTFKHKQPDYGFCSQGAVFKKIQTENHQSIIARLEDHSNNEQLELIKQYDYPFWTESILRDTVAYALNQLRKQVNKEDSFQQPYYSVQNLYQNFQYLQLLKKAGYSLENVLELLRSEYCDQLLFQRDRIRPKPYVPSMEEEDQLDSDIPYDM